MNKTHESPTREGLQRAKSSRRETIHTLHELDIEKAKALGDVLDAWRISQGWKPFDQKTQDKTIEIWCLLLDAEHVPHEYYAELFKRAMNFRAKELLKGREIPAFCVELLLAMWEPMRNEVIRKRIQERIGSRRILPEYAESQCPDCYGTGTQVVKGKGAKLCATCTMPD